MPPKRRAQKTTELQQQSKSSTGNAVLLFLCNLEDTTTFINTP